MPKTGQRVATDQVCSIDLTVLHFGIGPGRLGVNSIDDEDPHVSRDGMHALLIFPRFNADSFWALKDPCRMQGAKAPAPPLGLTSELGEWCTAGLNFATLRPQSEILRDQIKVLRSVYARDSYFARVNHMIGALGKPISPVEEPGPQGKVGKTPVWQTLATLGRLSKQILLHRPGQPSGSERNHTLRHLNTLGRLTKELVLHRSELLVPAWRLVAQCRKTNPERLPDALRNLGFYLHLSKFVDLVVADAEERIRLLEAEPAPPRHEPRELAAAG